MKTANQLSNKSGSLGFHARSLLCLALIIIFLLSACEKDEAQKMFDSGISLWKEQKYDEAVQNLIALTKAYPDNALVDDSLFWIASIYEHYLKEPDQAVRFYLSLNNKFEHSEYNTRSMLGLARVRAMQGEEGKRKAIRILKKLQKQDDPKLDDESWQQNQLQLAQLFFDLKNYQDARIELKRLIYNFSNSIYVPLAYYRIGKSFREEGNLELAILTFMEADKKFSHQRKSLSSALSLADIYEETGELKEAIDVYESILKRLEEKEVFYQLATNRIETLRQRVKKTKTG